MSFFNRKYAEALDYHRQALVLIPQNASTYSAIGYIHSLMGNFENAVDYFHTVCLSFSLTVVNMCSLFRRDQRLTSILFTGLNFFSDPVSILPLQRQCACCLVLIGLEVNSRLTDPA